MRLAYVSLLALLPIAFDTATAQEIEPQLDPAVSDYPAVLTPTRLRQSIADVPASVTVITAEMMRQYGITNVPDALRLVPGMAVTQVTSNNYRINYHGTNILDPRRMNVLIDGISVYQPALSKVDWHQLPVAMDDIDRIEVTRGPNSAAYGRNSMLAVINIITKHPNDVERAMVSTTFGSLHTRNATARFATTIGSTALRMTASAENDSGYDDLSREPQAHDSRRLKRLNLRSQTRLTEHSTLSFDAAVVRGEAEVPFIDPFQRSFPDQHFSDYYLGSRWVTRLSPTHELQVRANYSSHRVRQEWATCPPTATLVPELFALYSANPGYANAVLAGRLPSGGTATDDALAVAAIAAIRALGPRAGQPTCSTPNQNLHETRADVELQDTYVFSDRLRVVAGIGLREDRGTSATFFGGTVSNTSRRAFGNVEYKPYAWLNLNAGGYFERDQLTGPTFSSRVGANFHLSNRHTVRLAYSQGTRQPDIFEQRANWTYTANDLSPALNGSSFGRFYQSARATGQLRDERIISREIGYVFREPAWGMLLDAKAFDDKLTDLISEKLHLQSFAPTNSNAVRLRGLELQTTVSPSHRWSLFFAYAFLRNSSTTALERTQYSSHSGAIGLSRALGDGWRFALTYYGATGDGLGQNYYGREDLTLSKTFKVAGKPLSTSITLRHLDNTSLSFFRDFGDVLVSTYDDSFQIYSYLKLSF